MRYLLKVEKGTLKNRRGESAGMEIKVRGPQFLVGSGSDCQLCCRSRRISPHHCELSVVEGKLFVRDLQSETGTFVDGEQITDSTQLNAGDRLRVGRLEFEIVALAEAVEKQDPMSDFVSDILGKADDEDRERRMTDPLARQFAVQPASNEAPANSEEPSSHRKPARPPKQPPAKLPPPPDYVADDSMQAAEETLEKIYELNKLKKQKTRRFI